MGAARPGGAVWLVAGAWPGGARGGRPRAGLSLGQLGLFFPLRKAAAVAESPRLLTTS